MRFFPVPFSPQPVLGANILDILRSETENQKTMTQAPFKFCPACGQKLAIHMQQCGRCKALQPPLQAGFPTAAAPVTPPIVPPTMHVKTTLTKQQSKALGNKILAGCGGILLLFFVIGLFLPDRPSDAEAWVIATGYVRNSLKSPSSADFPLLAISTSHEGNVYYVRSYVDSQNGFGAQMRSGWSCKIEYISHLNWRLKGLNIDGEVIVPDEEQQQQAERNRQEDIRVYKELNRMDTGAPSPAHPYEERPATSYPVFPNRASGSASFPTIPSASTPSFQPPASYVQPPSVTYMPAPPPNQTLTPIFHNIPPLPGATHNGQDFGPGGPAGFGARPFGVSQGFGQPTQGQGSFGGGLGGRGF
jgi:hypothetical protein